MTQPIIKVADLRKTYGRFVAVDNVSFEVHPGEIFGLLGPNGAGKTTTLECLEGLRRPDAGQLQVAGIDPVREPRKLGQVSGVQLQASGMPEAMTPKEAMRFFCAYHGVSPRYDLLERFGLSSKLGTQFHELSTGQQRRLALALALAHEPQVLFLDEPTAGLDVASRSELHAMMQDVKASGRTIILATHDMAEAEQLADRVAILLHGRIVATGTPIELTATGAGLTKVSVRTRQSRLLDNGHAFPAASILLIPGLTTALHLAIVSLIILFSAPILFDATLPANGFNFLISGAALVLACTGIGVLIGVVSPSTRMTVLYSQIIFVPSMLLGGLMMPLSMLPEAAQKAAQLLPASQAMNAFNALAMGQTAVLNPWASVLMLTASGLLAFALALYLFSWDSKNSDRRGHPLLALLAFAPYLLGILLL